MCEELYNKLCNIYFILWWPQRSVLYEVSINYGVCLSNANQRHSALRWQLTHNNEGPFHLSRCQNHASWRHGHTTGEGISSNIITLFAEHSSPPVRLISYRLRDLLHDAERMVRNSIQEKNGISCRKCCVKQSNISTITTKNKSLFLPMSYNIHNLVWHDDFIKWKHFPRCWPFVRGIHRSRWIPLTKASDGELWCFLWSAPEQTVQ